MADWRIDGGGLWVVGLVHTYWWVRPVDVQPVQLPSADLLKTGQKSVPRLIPPCILRDKGPYQRAQMARYTAYVFVIAEGLNGWDTASMGLKGSRILHSSCTQPCTHLDRRDIRTIGTKRVRALVEATCVSSCSEVHWLMVIAA